MNKIKQVIMIHYTIPPVVGGVEFMIEPLSDLFAKHGWHVSLLTGKGNINKRNIKTTIIPELYPGYPTIQRMQENLKTGSHPDNYEIEVLNFEKKLMTLIGDIKTIIIHNIMTMPLNLVATHALYKYIENSPDKNFYLWVHDMAYLMKDHKKYLYENKPWSLLKTACQNVHYITISKYRKRQAMELLKLSSDKITTIPNGIDVGSFLQLNDATRRFIHLVGLLSLSNMLLVPARILPRKNLLRSLEILSELVKIDPSISLLISGSPDPSDSLSMEYYTRLKTQAEKYHLQNSNLILLHEIRQTLNIDDKANREIVHDLYHICKGVMLLSSDEGFGIPLLEAGISQKPLILSDLDVFYEIAGNSGLYISDVEPVDEAAEKIYHQVFKCAEIRTDMFKNVIENYSWNRIWEKYLSDLF